jgi:micrococcal nuclease
MKMTSRLLLLLAALSVFAAPASAVNVNSIQAKPTAKSITDMVTPNEEIVYIAKTGKKYHKSNCRYVKKSKTAIKKSEAQKRGYTACSVCKP